MKTKITTLAIVVLTLMSCNDTKKANAESINDNPEVTAESTTISNTMSIENTKWVITKLEGADMSDRDANAQEIYFTLDAASNRVNGNSGCNTFMGTYTIEDGGRISFSQMASTRMMCPDSKINESEVLSVFENADNFSISGDQLTLNKAKRAPLAEFKKVESSHTAIEGTHWKLKTLEGQDVAKADHQEQDIYFMLNTEGNRITGFAGCNTFGGEYTLEEGNRIRFKGMLATLKACPDSDVNESEFLKVFELADNYTINNGVLSLNVGRRAPLAVFEAVEL